MNKDINGFAQEMLEKRRQKDREIQAQIKVNQELNREEHLQKHIKPMLAGIPDGLRQSILMHIPEDQLFVEVLNKNVYLVDLRSYDLAPVMVTHFNQSDYSYWHVLEHEILPDEENMHFMDGNIGWTIKCYQEYSFDEAMGVALENYQRYQLAIPLADAAQAAKEANERAKENEPQVNALGRARIHLLRTAADQDPTADALVSIAASLFELARKANQND